MLRVDAQANGSLCYGGIEMKLPFLHQEVEVRTDLRESNDILDDPDALKERIAADGYLLIRGLHDKNTVLTARQQLLEKLAAKGMLAPDTPLMDGIFNPAYPEPTSTGSMGNKTLTQLPTFKAVVEGAPVMNFFKRLPRWRGTDIRFQVAPHSRPRIRFPDSLRYRLYGERHARPLLLLDTLRRCIA